MANTKPSLSSLPNVKPSLTSLPNTTVSAPDVVLPPIEVDVHSDKFNQLSYLQDYDKILSSVPKEEDAIYDAHELKVPEAFEVSFDKNNLIKKSNNFFDIFKKAAIYAGGLDPDKVAENMAKSLGYDKSVLQYANTDPLTKSTNPILVDPAIQVWNRKSSPSLDWKSVDSQSSFISQTTDKINQNAKKLEEDYNRVIEQKINDYALKYGETPITNDSWGIAKFIQNTLGAQTSEEKAIRELQDERDSKLADIKKTEQELKNIYADSYLQSSLLGNQKAISASKLYNPADAKSLEDIENSTQFLTTFKDASDQQIIDRYKNIGITSTNIDNPAKIKAKQLATKTSEQKFGLFGYSDVSNEENLYNGMMPEIQALSNTINEDKTKLEELQKGYDVNFSVEALNKLKSDGKVLSPEGEKFMDELSLAISVFRDNIKTKEDVKNRFFDILKKNTKNYKGYKDNQELLNYLRNESPFTETTVAGAQEFTTKLAGRLTQFAHLGAAKLSDNEVAAEKIFSERQFFQSYQKLYNGKYTDIGEIPAVQVFDKDGHFNFDADLSALWFQTVKTAGESTILGFSGQAAKLVGKKAIDRAIAKTVLESEFVATIPALQRAGIKGVDYIKTTGLGYVAPSVLMYSPEMINNEMKYKGLTFDQAFKIGVLRAVGQGWTEAMFLNELMIPKFLKGEIAPKQLAKITQEEAFKNAVVNGVEKQIGTKLTDAGYNFIFNPLAKTRLKQFAKGSLVVTTEEGLEEDLGDVWDKMSDKVAETYKAGYESDPLTVESLINTFVQTAATMAFQGVTGGVTKVREFNAVNNYTIDQSKYLVGSSPEIYRNTIKGQLADGTITQEEANRRSAQIDHLVGLYNSNTTTNTKIDDSKLSVLEKNAMKNELFIATLRENELSLVIPRNEKEASKLVQDVEAVFNHKQNLIDAIDNYVSSPEERREKLRVSTESKLFDATYTNKYINGLETKTEVSNIVTKLTRQLEKETSPELQDKITKTIGKLNTRLSQFTEETKPKPTEETFESIVEKISHLPAKAKDAYISMKINELAALSTYTDEKEGALINKLLDYNQTVNDEIVKEDKLAALNLLKEGDPVSYQGKSWTIKSVQDDNITLENQIQGGTETTTISKEDLLGRLKPVEAVAAPVSTLESLNKELQILKQQLTTAKEEEKQQILDGISYVEEEIKDLERTATVVPKYEEGEHIVKTTTNDGGFDDEYDSPRGLTELASLNKERRQNELDPNTSLEVTRTVGINPTTENINDPSLRTRLNVLAVLSKKLEETGNVSFENLDKHGYSLLILSTEDLLKRMFPALTIKTKEDIELYQDALIEQFELERINYWKQNGIGEDKESILVSADKGEILRFSDDGELDPNGRVAYYPIPQIHTAERQYDPDQILTNDKTGFKPGKTLLDKGQNRGIYEASLNVLKQIRAASKPVIYKIKKLSDGVIAKTNFTIGRPNVITFLKRTGLSDVSIYIEQTKEEKSTKQGAAYIMDSKGNKWLLKRPQLNRTGWINAIINMSLPNESISKDALATLKDLGLEEWEERYKYIGKLIYLSNKHTADLGLDISLTKDKKASLIKISERYFNRVKELDPNFNKLSEIENSDGTKTYVLYMDKSYSKDLFSMLLRDQKKLNLIKAPEVGNFNVISFEGGTTTGKFFIADGDTYTSYKDFVFNNFDVFAEPEKSIVELRNAGIKSFPGQYLQLDISDAQLIGEEDKLTGIVKVTPSQDINSLELEMSNLYDNTATAEEKKAAEDWWNSDATKHLRQSISLKKMLTIVNSKSFANFKDWTITLYNASNPTAIYHEAWHGFSQMFLTKRQKTNLYNELRRKSGDAPVIYIKGVKYEKKFSELTDKQAEEVLGEDFRLYAKSGGKISFGKEVAKQTIFGKMWNAIKEWLTGNVSLDEYYRRLYVGDIYNYEPSIDNQMFTSLDKSFDAFYNKNGKAFAKTIGSRQINEFVNVIDNIISQTLQNKGMMHILFSKDQDVVNRNLSRLYKFTQTEIGNKLATLTPDSEEYEDLNILYTNFDRFVTQIHSDQSYLFRNIKIEFDLTDFVESEKIDEDQENKHKISSLNTDEITDDDLVDRDNIVSFAEEGRYSAIEKASNEIIYLIATLPKYINGKLVQDRFGFTKLASFDITWYRLAKELQGVYDVEQMYKKIDQLGDKYPEFKELLKRLPDISNPATDLRQVTLVQQFIIDFSKPLVEMYEGILEKGDEGLTFRNIKSSNKATKTVKKIFTDIFKDIEDSKFVSKTETDQNKLVIPELVKEFAEITSDRDGNEIVELTSNTDKRLEFLKAIGFEFSQITLDSKDFRDSIDAKKVQVKYGKDILNLIFKDLLYLDKMGIEITEPIDQVSSRFKNHKVGNSSYDHKGEAANIEKLLNLEVQATNEYFEDSAINPNGDLVWQTQNYSKITLLYSDLNNTEKYPDYQSIISLPQYYYLDEAKNPGIRHSLILNSMFVLDEDGENFGKRRLDDYKNPVKISLKEIGGLKYREETGITRSSKTTDLSVFDKILYDFNSFVTNGIVEHMRYADKGSAKGTLVPKYISSGTFLPVAITKFSEEKVPVAARKIFELYFKREIDQIKQYYDIEATNPNSIKWYNTNDKLGSQFRIFDNILDQDTKDKLYKSIKSGTDTTTIANSVDLKPHLESFFDRQVAELRARLIKIPAIDNEGITRNFYNSKLGIIESKVGVNYLHFLHAFITNNYIYNIEQMSLLNGDLANFKKANDVHKRLSADSATGTFAFMNNYVQTFLNTLGRGQASILKGKGYTVADRKEDGTYNTAIFTDVVLRSQYTKAYLDEILKSANVDLTADELLTLPVAKATELINSKSNDLKDKTNILTTVLDKYSEITEGDALGLCTLDFYRNFKILIGQWNDVAEKAYHKAILGETLSEDEMYYFVPIKAQYSGPIANSESVFGRYVRIDAFDKFALVPILPSAVKGKPLEVFNNNLVKQGIDYAMFESGSKKSSIVKDGHFNQFYLGDINNRTLNDGTYNINSKFFTYLKEQVYIEPKIKKDIIYATQFNKLFSIDLYEDGKALSPEIEHLNNQYREVRNKLIHNELNRLFRELKVKREGNDFKLQDYSGIASILQKEFALRDLPDNMRDFLVLNSRNELEFSLDSSLSRQQINKILLSIVNNRLVKYKVNGDNYIQTAFTGWDTDNTLKIYEKKEKDGREYITKMQVKVSIGKFKPLLNLVWKGEKISTLDKLNSLLKNEEFVQANEDKLTIVGVRIPVQGANSMVNGIVQEFLPEETGSLIVLPTEITAIAGSDFDIDKLSMYTPNFKKNGELHKILTEEEKTKIKTKITDIYNELFEYINMPIDESKGRKVFRDSINHFLEEQEGYGLSYKEKVDGLKEFIRSEILNYTPNDAYQAFDFMLFGSFVERISDDIEDLYDDLHNSDKYALQNQLISITSRVLSLPKMFESLTTPNSNSILEPLAEEMNSIFHYSRKMDFSKVLGYPEQLNQFEANLVGKATLGIAAVHNTFGQLLKQHNVYLNRQYFIEEKTAYGRVKTKKVPVIRLKHNTVIVDGKSHISLAKIKDANNEHKISEVISQFINGYVDVAKGAWVFWLNATYEAAPVMFYLNHAGVPIKENIYLINQPIIRDYLRYKKFQKFIAGRAIDSFYQTLYPSKISELLFTDYLGSYSKSTVTKLNLFSDKNSKIFSEENLYKNVKEAKQLEDLTPEERHEQAAILAHYLDLEDQAQNLRHLMTSLNFDTRKIGSVFEAFDKNNAFDRVVETGMFPKESIEAIKHDSVISMLDMNPIVAKLYPKFYKIVESPAINNFISKHIKDADFGKSDIFESRFKNDLVGFMFNMFGRELDSPTGMFEPGTIFDKIAPQFSGKMVERLKSIKKAHPNLSKELPILDLLVGDRSKINSIYNIKPKKVLKETVDINSMIEDFKKGLEYSKLDPKSNTDIQEFFKDLIYFGFIQSGVNKNFTAYTNLLPTESISRIIDNAIPIMNKLIEKDPNFLTTFYIAYFMKNNPFLVKKAALKRVGLIESHGRDVSGHDIVEYHYNREGYRFKSNLTINDRIKDILGEEVTTAVSSEEEDPLYSYEDVNFSEETLGEEENNVSLNKTEDLTDKDIPDSTIDSCST